MKINHYISDGIYVITATGSLAGKEAFEFNQSLKPIIEEMAKSSQIVGMVFEMKGIQTIDSSGIGALTGKLVRMKKLRKKFALSHVSRSIHSALAAVNLDTVLTFYSTTNEALHILGTPDEFPISEPKKENTPPARDFMRPPTKK